MTRLGWWVHSEIIHFEKNPGAAPAHLEFSFGMQERRGSDPASTGEPLVLSGGELEIRARGIIDRVDAAPDGRAWVIDYKTGASSSIPTYSEVADGNSFQLFVYLLAVEQLLGFDPAAGFYLMVAEPPGARGSLPQRSALSCGEKPVQKASSPGRSCGSASWACSGPMPRTSPRAAFRCFPCPLIPRPLQARALLDCDARRGEAPEEAPEHRMARTALLAAAGELMARWGKIQDAQGMMDFDGLLSRARDLLRDRPEVRALYQRQFRYVHIDEFQDVDGVQAELVRLLCGFEGSEVEHPPRLFIVGDPQQSIYRFRGADVDQFARMERLIRDRAGRSLCLRRCFRSQARLVGFFNHTFERVFSWYRAALAAQPGGRQALGNLRKLIDLARQFDSGPTADLGDFIAHLEERLAYTPREAEAALELESGDTVKLLSIHQAKGLEWPVVAVADLGRQFQMPGGDNLLWDPAIGIGLKLRDENLKMEPGADYGRVKELLGHLELAEQRRVLYVAATRARDRLILSGSYNPEKFEPDLNGSRSWLQWIGAMYPIGQRPIAYPSDGEPVPVRVEEAPQIEALTQRWGREGLPGTGGACPGYGSCGA